MKTMGNIFSGLNIEQKKAVTHKTGPLLIVAGAGTGKTTVITKRIAYLVLQKLASPDEILALTFTNKAAEEMEERVDKIMPYGYTNLWISTFHTFAEKVLQEHGIDIGISPDSQLLDQTGAWLLVNENLDEFDLDYYSPRNNPAKFIKTMLSHFSHLKDEEISPEQYLEYAQNLKLSRDDAESLGGGSEKDEKQRVSEIANAFHVYQQILAKNNKMDFGDLINYCLKLFRQRPNVLKEYQKRFKYILVDEFQDTNWAQYDLIKMLSKPENNITVVADDDQSIYRFRGASMSNVIQFSKDYKSTAKLSLVKNYRSGQEILDLSYDFIQLNNPNRLEKAENINKKLVSVSKEKAYIEHLHCKDALSEARVVAQTIISLKNSDKDATWNDFAVLVRANAHSEPFSEALGVFGVPNQNYSALGLYKTPLAMNIISFMKILDDYHESRALFRIVSAPFLDISAEDIIKMNHFAYKKSVSLYEVLKTPQRAGVASNSSLVEINRLFGWITKYSSEAKIKKASLIILDWLNDGYVQYIQSLPEQESAAQFLILKSFYGHIKQIEDSIPDSRIHDIIRVIEGEVASGDAGSMPVDISAGPEMVRVMTIHSAKGLEFKYVFLVNMVDRRFPSIERKEAIEIPSDLVKEIIPQGDAHLEEERRLFYVGMTRAKLGLFFTSAENYGGSQKKKLSRFLSELSEVQKGFKPSSNTIDSGITDFAVRQPVARSKKFNLVLPSRFSFTQLKIFDECPFAYKMQFLLKVPLPGKFVFSYGTTMHSTLQQFIQSVAVSARARQVGLFSDTSDSTGVIPDEGYILDLYEKNWIEDWYEDENQKKRYKAKGKDALRMFYKKFAENEIPKTIALERLFNLKIGGYSIVGKMDRVDLVSGGAVAIIDYKTGSVPKQGKLSLGDKRQLLVYQIASEEVFGEKVEKLVFYYLDEGVEIEFLGSREEKDEVKKWILDTINSIKTSSFEPNSSKHICDYCDYFFDYA